MKFSILVRKAPQCLLRKFDGGLLQTIFGKSQKNLKFP